MAETFRLRTGSIDGEGLSLEAVRDCFAAFAAQESVMLTRETKKGPRTSDIRRHLLRWKELEDGSLEFSLDWSDGYLSPLLLCTSICASLGDESRLRALLRLSKTAQHFADEMCIRDSPQWPLPVRSATNGYSTAPSSQYAFPKAIKKDSPRAVLFYGLPSTGYCQQKRKNKKRERKTKNLTSTVQAQHFFGGPSEPAALPQAVTRHPP